jgi:hypothetical protein
VIWVAAMEPSPTAEATRLTEPWRTSPAERPLLALVDDAHWLDGPSAEAITFAARRLQADPIALVLAIRDARQTAFDGSGFTELQLHGLDPEAAGALVDSGGPLEPSVRAEVLRIAQGNPLTLLELPVPWLAGGPFAAVFLDGFARWLGPDPDGAVPRLRQAMDLAGQSADPRRLFWAGIAALVLGDDERARRFFGQETVRARSEGSVAMVAQALTMLSAIEFLQGHGASARATVTEGLELARATGQRNIACFHLAVLARVAASFGTEDERRTPAQHLRQTRHHLPHRAASRRPGPDNPGRRAVTRPHSRRPERAARCRLPGPGVFPEQQ